MKRVLLFFVMALPILAWAEDSKTVLPWGADEPWQMKFVVQPSDSFTDPPIDDDGNDWTQLGYNDSGWETLTGPMANGEPLCVDVYNYTWEGENKCFNLRRTFSLDAVDENGYTFATLHDDDISVYINGRLAFEKSGASANYDYFFLDASLFQEGENLLAIYFLGGPFTHNYLDYALFSGDGFNRGTHYAEKNIGVNMSIDHIVYDLNMEQGVATCQGWDWSGGFQPTESPNIRVSVTFDGIEYPVTTIGYYAFMDIDQHWDITIPEGIQYIQGYAFWDSPDIGHISIPSSMIGMGPIPCNVESVSVADGNPVYDSRDNCNAVIETETNRAVIVCDINKLPTSVTTLGGYCITGYRGDYAIDEFTIPNHISKTEDAFIPNGNYINVLNIPESLTDISAPMTLPVVNTINIDANNPRYYTEGNCILEKGTNRLIATWTNSKIPSYITAFGRNSLYNYSGKVSLNMRYPGEWYHEGEILGELSVLEVPRGAIPFYISQGWDQSPFKTITDGIHTYYNSTGNAWFAPHIAVLNYPSSTAGENITLSFQLNADRPVTGFQFELYLPDGMTINSDEDIQLSSQRTNEYQHSLSAERMSDGAWRVTCTPINNSTFADNEGEVCTIVVSTSSSMANHGYPILFKNVTTTYIGSDDLNHNYDYEQLTSYVNFFTPKKVPLQEANTLSVTAPSILLSKAASMSLNLKNEDEIIMTEFYLQLPEGISIAEDEDGFPDVTINSERNNNHNVEVVLGSDGLYHFLCYSSTNNSLKGNDGELFHINLVVDENIAPGTYQGSLKGILMSDIDRTELIQNDYTFDITIMDVEMGDVNGDGRINGLDIVDIIDYIMGRPSDNFVETASDLTADGVVNGMDLVKIVSLVLSQTTQNASARSLTHQYSRHSTGLSAQLQTTSTTEVNLGVTSSDEFILTQFVVEVSDGAQLLDVESDNSHIASWKYLGNNRYAVVVYSGRNSIFRANETMAHFLLSHESEIAITEMMVVDAERNEHKVNVLNAGVVTGIENVSGVSLNEKTVVDLQGRKINDPSVKGVYIINGKKAIVK